MQIVCSNNTLTPSTKFIYWKRGRETHFDEFYFNARDKQKHNWYIGHFSCKLTVLIMKLWIFMGIRNAAILDWTRVNLTVNSKLCEICASFPHCLRMYRFDVFFFAMSSIRSETSHNKKNRYPNITRSTQQHRDTIVCKLCTCRCISQRDVFHRFGCSAHNAHITRV